MQLAIGYFSRKLQRSNLCNHLIKICNDYDILLQIIGNSSIHLLKSNYMMTWGVKINPDVYKNCKNILFLENSLLSQKSGAWIDHRGWFDRSALCLEKQYNIRPKPHEIINLHNHCQQQFNWDLFEGSNNNGPILYGFQRGKDSTTMFHFKAKNDELGSELSALKMFYENCPDVPVIIRPHPLTVDRWKRERFEQYLRPHWTVDTSSNPYELLKKCSAFVSINSTLATEALSLGIPVATFGESAFTGSRTTLDCSTEPSNLKGILNWRPEKNAVLGYLCAVMRHHLNYNCSKKELMENKSLRFWLLKVASGS